ncbi:NRDE family protein [Thermodesulfobacteriota bacterium]
MCLILLSFDIHPVYRVVLAANRDEYYDRPTKPLAFWDDISEILAGRDLKRSGAWLGVTRTGRIAAITNYREPFLRLENAPSRGLLVSDFLSGMESPKHYLDNIKTTGHRYNGFNLLIGDQSGLFYYSNKGHTIQKLKPGLYGLSNHLLDTPWPKIEKGKAALGALLDGRDNIDLEDVFHILANRSYPPDDQLPDTGVDHDWERVLSPLFITSPSYGTRSSSVVVMERTGGVVFAERTFEPQQAESSENQTRIFNFTIST